MRNMKTKEITTLSILIGMALIVNILIHFPLVPAVGWLSYDPKDVIIVIGGFIYGPFASFLMSMICSVLEIFFRPGNFIDILMNVISTSAFACVAAFVYKKNHTKQGAMIGLILGVLCTTFCMTLWNYIVTPIYFGMPREAVVAILLPGIIPFNLLKSGLNAGITLLLYKSIVTILRTTNLVESHQQKQTGKGLFFVGLFITITIVGIVVAIQGII